MAGYSSLDDKLTENTTNGKYCRTEWVKQTGASVQAVGCAYDLNCYSGNPSAFLYTGVTKTFVAMDSSVYANITTGTATSGSASVTGITNNANIKIGMSWNGTAGTVTFPANTSIINVSVSGTTTVTLSANATGSSTGTPIVVASWPNVWHGGNQSSDLKFLENAGFGYYAAAFGANFIKFVDVLGYYPILSTDVTSTSQRTMTNTITLPRWTTGAGVRAYFVAPIQPTGGGPNLTEFTYVNQDGTSGRTSPLAVAMNATAGAIVGQIPSLLTGASKCLEIPLANGDSGIRSVTSFTFSSGTPYSGSGALALVLMRPICTIPMGQVGVYSERTFLMNSPLQQIQDGACINMLNYASGATTAATTILGHAEFGWG